MILALVLCLGSPCQIPGDRPIQPYTVQSNSGAWTLEVMPTSPDASDPMHVRLLHGKDEGWSKDIPWTFERAGVAEDGTVVGCSNGDELRIAVVDSKGVVRRQFEDTRTEPFVDSLRLVPEAWGPVLVHTSADLALIPVLEEKVESDDPTWRAFRLSTGEALPKVVVARPSEFAAGIDGFEHGVCSVGDTQLTLVHWWFWHDAPEPFDPPLYGGWISLHDTAGRVVWALRLPHEDIERIRKVKSERKAPSDDRPSPILAAGPGDTFVLRHVMEKTRVEYAVTKDASGAWQVKETRRSPWTETAPTASSVTAEPIQLEPKGRPSLRTKPAGPASPIHDVEALGFTARGEIDLIRRSIRSEPSYVRLRPNGDVALERDLSFAVPDPGSIVSFFDLAHDRWLLNITDEETDDEFWSLVDIETGAAQSLSLPTGGSSGHVAAFEDGSFVLHVDHHLCHVRPDGTIVWMHHSDANYQDGTEFERAVGWTKGLARVDAHSFAVLGSDSLAHVDLERTVLHVWKLEDLLGREPKYMDGLIADSKGGVLFEESDEFHHVDSLGKPLESFVIRRADGSTDDRMNRLLSTAPDGRMWTSDGHRLYRLDDRGKAELVLGPALDPDALGMAGETGIDECGRVLLQDESTGAIHVFDAEGKRLAICTLTPRERASEYVNEAFRGLGDGSILVATSDGLVTFDAYGKRDTVRHGSSSTMLRDVSKEFDDVDAGGKALRSIRRRPDGKWLSNAKERARLQNGRCVVLEPAHAPQAPVELHVYAEDGKPLRTIALPFETETRRLSASARWIAVGGFGPWWTLVRVEDGKVFRFDSGLEDPGYWLPGVTADGKTLLLLHARRLELVRFALP